MKKFFVSVGLAAAGAVGLQTTRAFALDAPNPRLWNVSASLRGFYDDNYDTLTQKKGSFGFEVSPQIGFSVPMQQTEFGMRYTYGLYYYQDRQEIGVNPVDQSHQLDLWLDHSFTVRWSAKLQDTLAIGQEPELIQGGTPFRVEGNNVANTATFSLNTDWTREFSTSLSISDRFYDYSNSGATVTDPVVADQINPTPPPYVYVTGTGTPGSVVSSLAGLLNRIENSANLDLQWHLATETMFFVGGSVSQVNYLGNEDVSYFSPFPYTQNILYRSSDRDNRSFGGHVGIQHNLLENLSVSVQVGAEYIDDYNDPLSSPSFSPTASVSLIYTYLPGSYAQLGFNHGQNATDVITPDAHGRITMSQESSMIYASINHQFTPKLAGVVIGSFQYSDFNYGAYSSQPDKDFSLGVNLKYTFNRHFSAEIGYNFDDLQSGIDGRAYTRNRVYLGMGAAY